MPLQLMRNDITKLSTDAIVNAGNTRLKTGGGVCGAIFNAAGAQEMQKACDSIGGCSEGMAVITPGFHLPAKYVIHTVGPVWKGGSAGEEQILASCYRSALNLARQHDLQSIAFPLLSSGIYGYPKDKAMKVAISAISDFLMENEMMVYLVLFDKDSCHISEKLFEEITSYIDDHYVEEHSFAARLQRQAEEYMEYDGHPQAAPATASAFPSYRSLNEVMKHVGETFSQMLLRLIDEKGKTDVETYKLANVDRKLFSKIRSDPYYKPSRNTAIAFAIALKLNMDETRDLLNRAGFALSSSSKFDLIVEYHIQNGIYNIYEINDVLFAFEQPTLGV